jgi:MFS family permease
LARAFQGIGSAILAPTTLALLMDTYQGEARTRAVAAYGATAGIGASLGLVIGGIFASLFSWRDGFFINVPIAFVMLILAAKYIHEKNATKGGKLDLAGAITSVIGMVALVYSLVGAHHNVLALGVAVVFIGLFIFQEARSKQAMMPLRLYTDKERLGAYIARFLYLGAMLSMWFLTPQIMQTQLGFSPLQAGIGFFPLTIVNFVIALQVAHLTKRFGNAKLLVIGIATTAIGMFVMSFFTPTLGYVLGIAIPMVLMGFGQGLTLSPLTVAGIANTRPEDSGAASGVVNMVHQIGGSIGMSFIVAVSSHFSGDIRSYHAAMLVATALLFVALVAIIGLVVPTTKKK